MLAYNIMFGTIMFAPTSSHGRRTAELPHLAHVTHAPQTVLNGLTSRFALSAPNSLCQRAAQARMV